MSLENDQQAMVPSDFEPGVDAALPTDEVVELSDEELEWVSGGKPLKGSAEAYCRRAVAAYKKRGFTKSQMRKDMLSQQKRLKKIGDTALAKQNATSLKRMLELW